MLNYELAKGLKEARFPQLGDGYALILDSRPDIVEDEADRPVHSLSWNAYVFRSDMGNKAIYSPSLSELIGACGDKFVNLFRHVVGSEIFWCATSNPADHGDGRDPEEAVARLWLALNKK